MSSLGATERGFDPESWGALASPRRRRIVETLEAEHALELEELAARVTAAESDRRRQTTDGDDEQRTMVELIHLDLPLLAEASLIEFDPDERVVSCTERTKEAVASADLPEEVIDALADRRRRTTLDVLARSETPVSVETLARRVTSAEGGVPPAEVPEDYCHAVHVTLHHTHLPKLADAGLVTYDESAHEVDRSPRLLEAVAELVGRDVDVFEGSESPDGY